MKLRINQWNTALTSAKATRKHYAIIKAPTTQNVRNPLPMHTLLRQVLPTLPDEFTTVDCTITAKINGAVYETTVAVPAFTIAENNPNLWADNGALTVKEICAKLEAMGYAASQPLVSQTLSKYGFGSARGTKTGAIGPRPKTYFVRS